ncbi:MAG: AAA family ATPase [Desulfotignum sp.]|nr:AAA family ATPase [Desulfotignum sp.]
MYKEYYLMQDEPFAPFPSPYLFYKSKNHAKTWKNIVHNLRKKEPVVMVAGEYGTGKTLLCLKMIRFMEKYRVQPRIHIPSPGYDFSMVLEKIARELGLIVDPGNAAECRRAVYEYFETGAPEKNQYLYIVIDDIHEFDYTFISELTKLITYNYNGYFPIKLFMFGHTSFLKSLDKRNLISFKQRVRVVPLAALTMSEVTEYIYFRLIASGASGSPVFNEDAIALITEMSRGLPRLINKICDSSLVLAYKKRVNVIDRSIVAAALAEEGLLDFDEHIEASQFSRSPGGAPAGISKTGTRRPGTRTAHEPAQEPVREQKKVQAPVMSRRANDLFSEPEPEKQSAKRKKIPGMDMKKTAAIDGKTLTIASLIIIMILMVLFFIKEMRTTPMPEPRDLMDNNKTGSIITKPIRYPEADGTYHVVTKPITRPVPDEPVLPAQRRFHPVVKEFLDTETDTPLLSGPENNGPVLFDNHVTEFYNQNG